MTTIACDGETLASDSQSITQFVEQHPTQKIFRKGGRLFALAGDYAQCLAVIDWLCGEEKPSFGKNEFVVAVVSAKKADVYDGEFYPYPAIPPFAFGSGGVFAMAAMMGGAKAKKAVEIACQLDENSGGKIRTFKV